MSDCQPILSEAALIETARAGNRNAFGEIVRRYSGRIYRVSYKILKNREDAEDNLQNVFCKACDRISQFEGRSQLSTWLTRIAINEALMKLRNHRTDDRVESLDSDASDDSPARQVRDWKPDPERLCINRELTAKAFEDLPDTLRDTFLLNKLEGWTNRELAQASGVGIETVKSRVFRARTRLRHQVRSLTTNKNSAIPRRQVRPAYAGAVNQKPN